MDIDDIDSFIVEPADARELRSSVAGLRRMLQHEPQSANILDGLGRLRGLLEEVTDRDQPTSVFHLISRSEGPAFQGAGEDRNRIDVEALLKSAKDAANRVLTRGARTGGRIWKSATNPLVVAACLATQPGEPWDTGDVEHMLGFFLGLAIATLISERMDHAEVNPQESLPQGPTDSVFLSYTKEDSAWAERIDGELTKAGIMVMTHEKDRRPGPFRPRLVELINETQGTLVLLSRATSSSQWVEWEYVTAMISSKTVVPVLVGSESDVIPVPLILAELEYEDLRRNWDTGVQRLIALLRGLPVMVRR